MPDSDNVSKNSGLALFVVLCVVWFAWSGHTETLIIIFGLGSVLLCVYMSRSLDIVDSEGQPVNMKLLFYLPWLFKEIVVANIDVIKRIMSLGPIEDQISLTWTKVPAHQKTRLGRVIFANSITLTPGTISVEIEDGPEQAQKYILVNALSSDGAASLVDGGIMGAKVCKTEDG